MTYPSVYPTGVTIYNPEKCWNGYTVFQAAEQGALVIDMNGAEVQLWKGLYGFPNKLLPGGYVLGHTGERNPFYGMQDMIDLVQVDWEGNIVWKFNMYEFIEDPGEKPQWMARQHHDYQREGNPVGYYVPGMEPRVDGGNTLILCHKNLKNPKISEKLLLDDTIIEVTWEGDIVWEWICSDHFDEYGFSEEAKNILCRDPNMRPNGGGMGDWMHINSMSVLGSNKWYDAGDERFHPDNIIWDGRETNIIAIIDKKSGNIVWKIGPDYNTSKELKALGWIIGQHHAHMIPKGLPGEGNILLFDNGGWAGYGAPNPSSPTGRMNALRDYSRVLEIDPTTLKIVWQYTPAEAGYMMPFDSNRFYSPFISGAQRLPNGNTLITEGSGGRIIEVTPNHEIVWEYISPYWGKVIKLNMVYRAYRAPYEWIPQLDPPKETPIERLDVKTFRVPGAAPIGRKKETTVEGVLPPHTPPPGFAPLCVAADV
ncbi:Arylsulfotransferase (ASST) [Neomoorella glycerini]|uniref:Arylsulfotransferase (ASST) n=1 Tax=Neomoorella glycerini TaxID=55779 RepID=A0A6I5ZN83_9FIRM|nr:aryl-sulfate sulfotransferase [Moorella glycerini]QGP91384.1 Arylsulfotransferase (ASST) [Moorella glycerini]